MAVVMVYGVGDLGERIVYGLAAVLPRRHHLVVGGRSESIREVAEVASLVARHASVSSDALPVSTWAGDLGDPSRVAEMWDRLRVDVVVFTATRLTWWKIPRLPDAVRLRLENGGFGVWLPAQADLLVQCAQALRLMACPPMLFIGPYPDVTGSILKGLGSRRLAGFGNVDELWALVMRQVEAHIGTVPEVHLAAHHSVEAALFSGRPLPPHRLRVRIRDQELTWTLRREWPWPSGTRSHAWTAQSAVRAVSAYIGDDLQRVHLAGPDGLPGGYPCLVGQGTYGLDLPDAWDYEDTVQVNRDAATYDGIKDIARDGTVTFTAACQEAWRSGLNLHWKELSPHDMHAAAQELAARFKELTKT